MPNLTFSGRVRRGSFELEADFQVELGQTLVLTGPNGSGKTTLLRTIAGLEHLTEGEIKIDGQTLDSPSEKTFVLPEKRKTGMVFSEPRLLQNLTVLENAAFGMPQKKEEKEAPAEISEVLKTLGIAEICGKLPGELSRGQAQRAAIARALLIRPDILLLDEPLTGIDAPSQKYIGSLFELGKPKNAASAPSSPRPDIPLPSAPPESAPPEILSNILSGIKATILVTHNPIDALSAGDQILELK